MSSENFGADERLETALTRSLMRLAFWLCGGLQLQANASVQWLLEAACPALDRIDLYTAQRLRRVRPSNWR